MGPKTLRVDVHTDGGARGNPGPAAAAFVITETDAETVLRQEGHFLGRATNNVAEYSAMIAALRAAEALGAGEVNIFSDSQLMVRQMTGRYRVKNEGLKPLFTEARRLAGQFDRCEYHYIRRESNLQADALVNQALDLERNVGDAADQGRPPPPRVGRGAIR